MSAVKSSSSSRRSTAEILPRHSYQEVAELLATAMLRMRAGKSESGGNALSEVCLGFAGDQRVHANPSDTEGVRN